MLKKLAELFGTNTTNEVHAGPEALQLATCAILLEAAHVDDDFTQEEQRYIRDVVKSRFNLSDEDAHELLQAAENAREENAELFRYTREINENCTVDEKIRFVEEIWRIFYSDGKLDSHEDHMARKLRDLLNLNVPQMMDAKMRVKEELSR